MMKKGLLLLTLITLSLSAFAKDYPIILKGMKKDKILRVEEFVDGGILLFEIDSRSNLLCRRGTTFPVKDGIRSNSKNLELKFSADGKTVIKDRLTSNLSGCSYDLVGSLSFLKVRNHKKTKSYTIPLSILQNNLGAKLIVECSDRLSCDLKEIDQANDGQEVTTVEVHFIEY